MKQLKFMLAAATAISLATAAQAADQTNELANDTFDTDEALSAAYTYIPASDNDNDNESAIVEGGYNSSAKALKVNTGTNPLLRSLDWSGTAARPVDMTATDFKSLYIDTMVQFTVTPDGDTVTAGDDDKLMIYLKEIPAEGETPASTKLMVKALQFAPESAPGVGDGMQQVTDVEIDLGEKQILANEWYRLVVTAKAQDLGDGTYLPVFSITLDGTTLTSGSVSLASDGSYSNFPSIQGPAAKPALTYVGFAGEGMVDDLTVATITEQTSVDFTFTLSWGDGISAVTYTIAGDETGAKTPENGKAFTVPGTGSFTINYKLDGWYTLNDANPTLSYDFAPNGSGSLNLATTKLTSKEENGNVVVNPNATVTEVQAAAGITEGAFFAEGTTKADLEKALTWKNKNNANGKADINKITFNTTSIGVEPTSSEAEAYLLDCDPQNLESEKDKFKLEITFDENGLPVVAGPEGASTYKNGTVVLKGRTSLTTGEWVDKAEGHKFFKAFLVK